MVQAFAKFLEHFTCVIGKAPTFKLAYTLVTTRSQLFVKLLSFSRRQVLYTNNSTKWVIFGLPVIFKDSEAKRCTWIWVRKLVVV